MPARVKLTIIPSAVVNVIGPQVDDAAYRAAQRTRGRVISNIRALGRIRTGKMINSVQVRRSIGASAPLNRRYDIYSSAWYTPLQEDGTRAHGPVRAPFMVFTPKGSNVVVFARWVRGVPPGHFFRDALRDVDPSDFE